MYRDGSSESLIEALRMILTDDALQASMSCAARRTVEEQFTVSRMVDGMEAAIRYAHSTQRAAMDKVRLNTPIPRTESPDSSYIPTRPRVN
jgi:hypothetical protein